MNRRSFLELSYGALGAPWFAWAAPQSTRAIPRTKIFTVFFDIAPSRDDTDLTPMTTRICGSRECDGVASCGILPRRRRMRCSMNESQEPV
jgi:hypothetical protein